MTPPTRPGLPTPSTVLAVITMTPGAVDAAGPTPAAPGAPGPTLRILRTNQVDPYETQPGSDAEVIAAPMAMAAAGETFAGTDRRKAKLSVSSAAVESFPDISDLIDSLAPENAMTHHTPKIKRDAASDRVEEEDRNVRVTAWLYAASREKDNDFHLIVGRSPTKDPTYMTMEISGLPSSGAASHAALKKVRDTHKKFFGQNLPGTGYDFYDPPVKVEIGGSLFFDVTHAKGGRPGPEDLRPDMPVIWEVHPVSHLKFL